MTNGALHALRRLLGAVVLGTATLFAMRPDPKRHWSTPPRIRIVGPSRFMSRAEPPMLGRDGTLFVLPLRIP